MNKLRAEVEKVFDQNSSTSKFDVSKDYFNWGRDKRHMVDDTEKMPTSPGSMRRFSLQRLLLKVVRRIRSKTFVMFRFDKQFAAFDETFQLMSNNSSKHLFAELILIRLVGEGNMRLSTFTQEFIHTYEAASEDILKSEESLNVYKWVLRKIKLEQPDIFFFTTPVNLALCNANRLYTYTANDCSIKVEKGDMVLDAGVGWGDTTVYLAGLANPKSGGHSYTFDILQDGMDALDEQLALNKKLTNVTPVLRALSDTDDEVVHISAPSPGARMVEEETEHSVKTITIDTFVREKALNSVDFIKMDIEGAEIPALKGAQDTIKTHKPKLAISVYHKWDDLLTIPKLIHSIRDDYEYYLDCTTGFGGEAILYCK